MAKIEKGRSAVKSQLVNLTRKRPLGWPRRRWEDNFRMDLKEMDISMQGIGLIQLRIGIIGEPL